MEQKAISSDLIRGHIDTIILYTLISGDKFAQQISDAIEEKSNGDYKMNQATLYSSLKRLESLKLVSAYWFDAVDVGGRRKYFKITDDGKNAVQENLENWSFSRCLIDKLVDCSPTLVETKIVEKIVEVPVAVKIEQPVEPKIQEKTLVDDKVLSSSIDSDVVVKTENDVKKDEVVVETVVSEKNSDLSDHSSQEINFRNILNSLIKSTVVKKQTIVVDDKMDEIPVEKIELTPIQKDVDDIEKPQEKSSEKLSFNETISSVDFNERKSSNNGKIDFGDLVLKASKEGYKIRISSKEPAGSCGNLFINKLNLFSILIVFAIAVLEFVSFIVFAGKQINLNFVSILIAGLVVVAAPLVFLIKYFVQPKKKINKTIYSDGILTSLIIVFNLILVTFVCSLLLGVDFNDNSSLIKYFIIPCVVYLDIFVFAVVKKMLSKLKIFYVK